MSLLDALYFSTETVATVGYGLGNGRAGPHGRRVDDADQPGESVPDH